MQHTKTAIKNSMLLFFVFNFVVLFAAYPPLSIHAAKTNTEINPEP